MTYDTRSARLIRMLFYLKGNPDTLDNFVHFFQFRKSAISNCCSEIKALGIDVRQKESDAIEGNIRSVQRNQNHDNQCLNRLIFKP
jgi:hypothetical protein